VFDFVEYMRKIAINHELIGHTDQAERFFRCTSLVRMEELLTRLGSADGIVLMALDNDDGRYDDQISDNVLDRRFLVFFLLSRIEHEDFDKLEQLRKDLAAIQKDIVGKMIYDRIRHKNDLRNFQPGTVNYFGVGPLADNWFGRQISFVILEQAAPPYLSNKFLTDF
jgi:hypothetical protein